MKGVADDNERNAILLLDADPGLRDELQEAVDRFDMAVTWRARSPGLAETVSEVRPLAVVLSADLPDSDPLPLLRSVRHLDLRHHLPVYLIAEDPSRTLALRAYAEGADAVLARSGAIPEIAARALARADARRAPGGSGQAGSEEEAGSVPDAGSGSEGDEVPPSLLPIGVSPPPGSIPRGVPAAGPAPSRPSFELEEPGSDDASVPGDRRPATPIAVPDVVIVEDDASLLEMLRYALTNRGYKTLSFSNGLDALRALREMDLAGRHPVVLLDVDLPGIDGFRILHELSGCRPGDFQIILCTVHNSEATQVLGIQSGALDYLVKPLRMPIVLAKVERLLGRGSFQSAALG